MGKLLRLKKENLLAKEKSIDKNIIKLEAEKKSVKSDLEKETAAFNLMESKISTGLIKLGKEMKSAHGKTRDPKDCRGRAPTGPPPCPECPVCFEDMVPPMNIIQCE